jgi:phosphoribosylanthranilate isomerase
VTAAAASRFVKICGVRTPDDALACARAGADAVGLNFWPRSKRYLGASPAAPFADALAAAHAVARAVGPAVRRYGVFVDAPLADVQRALAEGAIDVAQLHGDEPPAYCAQLAAYMKALRLRDDASLAALDAYGGELVLVDADAPDYGGSGLRADVDLARRAAARRRVVLAGGLTPENVAAAIAAVRPFGVDVAGGVESAPGVKDPRKIVAFVTAARSVRA